MGGRLDLGDRHDDLVGDIEPLIRQQAAGQGLLLLDHQRLRIESLLLNEHADQGACLLPVSADNVRAESEVSKLGHRQNYRLAVAVEASSSPTPTSNSQAPDTMKTNDDIIPSPTRYRPQAPPKKRTTAPACSTTRQMKLPTGRRSEQPDGCCCRGWPRRPAERQSAPTPPPGRSVRP